MLGYVSERGGRGGRHGSSQRDADRGQSTRGVSSSEGSVRGGRSGSVEADAKNFLNILANGFDNSGAIASRCPPSLHSGRNGEGFRYERRESSDPDRGRSGDDLVRSAPFEQSRSLPGRKLARVTRDGSLTEYESKHSDVGGAAIEVRSSLKMFYFENARGA